MDYTKNEDYYTTDRLASTANYNCIIDISLIEDSSNATEPVTLAEALAQANIDNITNEDALIESYITVARMQCEGYTGIGFIEREVVAIVNNTLGNIYLPYGPIASVTTVTDIDGNVIDADSYKISGVKFKQVVYPCKNWLQVNYIAGYAELPQVFKTAILQQVAYLYEHRGDEKADTFSPLAKSLLKPFRRVC